MRRTTLVLALTTLLLTPIAVADVSKDTVTSLLRDNKDFDGGYVKTIYGGEEFNLVVHDVGTVSFTVARDGSGIHNIKPKQATQPDNRLTTTKNVVKRINNSEKPVQTALRAYRNGDVQLEGVGVWNTIKTGVVSWLI